MNSAANENLVHRTKIFETILTSPGMQQTCKIVLNPTRQTILVLARLLEIEGVNGHENQDDQILSCLPENTIAELKNISEELLKKGGLVELYEHLKEL